MTARAYLISIVFCAMALLIMPAGGYAAAGAELDDLDAELEALLSGVEEVKHYEFPKIDPQGHIHLGVILSETSGSKAISKCTSTDPALVLSAHFRIFDFPQRYYLEFERAGEHAMFADLRYAAGEAVIFRWLRTAVVHNLASANPVDLNPSTSAFSVSAKDKDNDHTVNTDIMRTMMRFKAPGYPAHAFVSLLSVTREGTRRQISLAGSAFYNDLVRATNSRTVDSESQRMQAGLNSHLGPVEVQYEMGASTFESYSRSVLLDPYTASSSRSAGTWPHHVTPRLTSASQTIKIHSSYTGKIVLSGTVHALRRENEYSGAASGMLVTTAAVTAMPSGSTTFVLRYRHRELNAKDMGSVTAKDTTGTALTYQLKAPLNTRTDTIGLTARLRPMRSLTLLGEYEYHAVTREHAFDWGLTADRTNRHTFSAGAKITPSSSLGIDLNLSHQSTDTPAYNVEPDQMNSAGISVSWTPTARMALLTRYGLSYAERSGLRYGNTADAEDRRSYGETMLVSLNYTLSDTAGVSAGFATFRNSIRQDLAYATPGGSPMISPDVVQDDRTDMLTLDAHVRPSERLTLTASAVRTESEGRFRTNNADLLLPISVADLTALAFTETSFEGTASYGLERGSSVKLTLGYAKIDDTSGNGYDELQDGTVTRVGLMYSRDVL